jgi:hypothetical protein
MVLVLLVLFLLSGVLERSPRVLSIALDGDTGEFGDLDLDLREAES